MIVSPATVAAATVTVGEQPPEEEVREVHRETAGVRNRQRKQRPQRAQAPAVPGVVAVGGGV